MAPALAQSATMKVAASASAASTSTSSAARSPFLAGTPVVAPRARRSAAPGAGKAQRQPRLLITRATAAPEKPFAAWDLPATIPFREDIKTIMIIGAGPIIIGQVGALSPPPQTTCYTDTLRVEI
jgi:hypothetical protein